MQDTITIEEAIKHCEEVVEKQEITAKSNLMEIDKIKADGILRLYDADEYESCMKCASDHRQLAEWLRELKKWRALRDSINMLCDVDCEYPQYKERGTMCDACQIGTVKEYFEQIFDEEVSADEEGE